MQSLKQRAGVDPDAIEGCPLPHYSIRDRGSGVGDQEIPVATQDIASPPVASPSTASPSTASPSTASPSTASPCSVVWLSDHLARTGRRMPALAGVARGHAPAASHLTPRSNPHDADHVPASNVSAADSAGSGVGVDVHGLANHVAILGSWADVQAQRGWVRRSAPIPAHSLISPCCFLVHFQHQIS